MTLELSLVLKATVLLAIGLTAVRLARRTRASVRHLMLASAFAAIVVLPIAATLVPAVEVKFPVAEASSSATAVFQHVAAPATTPGPPQGREDLQRMLSWSSLPTATVLRGLWGLGVAFIVAALAGSLWNLRRIRRSGIPWIAGQTWAEEIAAQAGIGRPVTVILHERIAVPVTTGFVRPAILLPPDAPHWTKADLRRAFVHELEHVRRGDWWVHLAARAICAAYWFHPLVWVAWRQLGLEGERACDDAVVCGMERTDYADQLVTLAGRLSKPQPMLSMANRSDLSLRVNAILNPSQRRGRPGVIAAAATIAVAVILLGTVAPLRAVAVPRDSTGIGRAQQTASLDAATLARNVALINAAGRGNGVRVTELLNSGAQVNAMISGDGSPLIAAARGGALQVVRLLLNRGADPDLSVRGDGSPLIAAAHEGHIDIVQMLLDHGASIDRIVEDDENPLIQASAEGHLDVVKLLVTRGANVNARAWAASSRLPGGGEWRTPLNMARRRGHQAVVSYLMSAGAVE